MVKKQRRNESLQVQVLPSNEEIEKAPRNFSELIQEFLDFQDIRPASKEVYRNGLKKFLNWIEKNDIPQPTQKDVSNFKIYLNEIGLAGNTIGSFLVSIRRFFVWTEGEGLYRNIAKGIKVTRKARGHLKDPLTAFQINQLLEKIDTSTIRGKRDFAIVHLLASTGMRSISVSRLLIKDFKQISENAGRFYHQQKGSDTKDQPSVLIEKPLKAILSYIKARGKVDPSDHVFVSYSDRNHGKKLTTRTIQNAIKSLMEKAGINDNRLTTHSLRHFFATNSLSNGASIQSVSQAMGHRSIETTQTYLHEMDRTGPKAAERFIEY